MNDPGATHFYGDGCDEAHGSWANMEQALAAATAENDRLGADLARMYRLRRHEHRFVTAVLAFTHEPVTREEERDHSVQCADDYDHVWVARIDAIIARYRADQAADGVIVVVDHEGPCTFIAGTGACSQCHRLATGVTA